MKTKFLYTIVIAVISSIWIFYPNNSGADEKPINKDIIKFSHQLHKEADVSCADCHSGVSESTSLTDRLLPVKDVCASCHDVDDDTACQTCHYEEKFEPLIQSTSELVFNHKFHVIEQKTDCESCHIGLTEVDYSSELKTSNPSMISCYQCHNDKSVAANVCESCHISTVNLIPQSHKSVDFFKNHKFSANHPKADCAMCHDNNFCESCHVSTNGISSANTATDFYTPYSPHRYTDNVKQQQITRVHDLNYRFSHGMDARGKNSECSTCHQTETFCAECHSSMGGDYASGGFVPKSHSDPNFVTIGVGTGGGVHAISAKRDIESCAACHDTQGADPNCILCHTDADGIKGTNPRTHAAGFMKNINGDWHGDFGAVCYDCHTDPFAISQTAGKGFCGYCHN
jgi:hypothetical protein